MTTINEAIFSLRPNTEWIMQEESIETIIWITENVEPLTSVEVKKEIARLDKLAKTKAETDAVTRQAAIDHAKSLGFTDDMIALMYPNLVQ